MRFEHIAINVPDSRSMADWYVKHCGLRIVIQVDDPPFIRFLGDQQGNTCIEIYQNPSADIPDYPNQDPLVYHHAFAVDDPQIISEKLQQAGASFVSETNLPNGTLLIMLRDPWGIPLQLVQRNNPWY